MQYQWDFNPVWNQFPLLLDGALGTLVLVMYSLLVAVPLGLLLALVRLKKTPILNILVVAYVELFRSAPSIVLIYWCFFALPVLVGLEFSPLTATVLAVGLQASAFMCEVFRGGIVAIPRGQTEAALALGMSRQALFTSVVLPQALRNMLPIFLLRLIDLIKATSLAATIAYGEVVFSAFSISSSTFRPIETFTVLGGIFFVMIFALSWCSKALERYFGLSEVKA